MFATLRAARCGLRGSCSVQIRAIILKYLPLCVAEFQFRYTNRENDNIFGEAIKGC
jgi:hypothetical protein